MSSDTKSLLARCQELEAEAASASQGMNDLILEIESVTADEAAAREQSAKLLRQVIEGQELQSGVLEENLALQNSVSDIQLRCENIQAKSVFSILSLSFLSPPLFNYSLSYVCS